MENAVISATASTAYKSGNKRSSLPTKGRALSLIQKYWNQAVAEVVWWAEARDIRSIMNQVDGLQKRIDELNAYKGKPFGKPRLDNGSVIFPSEKIQIRVTPCFEVAPANPGLPHSVSSFSGLNIQVIVNGGSVYFAPPQRTLHPEAVTRKDAVAWIANQNALDDMSKEVIAGTVLETLPRPMFSPLTAFYKFRTARPAQG